MLQAPTRSAFYFFRFCGPGFNLPLNFRASSISVFVHRRMEPLPNAIGVGAAIVLAAIQE